MKKLCLILILSAFTIACNDPRNVILPQDTSDIDDFSEKVKTLNPEEKYLLNVYLNYHRGGKVPVGKTVQEAVDETRKYLKEEDQYSPPE